MTPKKITAGFLAATLAVGVPVSGFAADLHSFADAPTPSHWSYNAINYAVDEDLLKGLGENLGLNQPLTRAQMAAVAVRLLNLSGGAGINFSDVPNDAWYAPAVKTAAHHGLISGVGNNLMNPNANISREAVFSIFARIIQNTEADAAILNQFKDNADISDWARKDIAALVQAGIISGDNGQLRPQDSVTREEFAALLYKAFPNIIDTPAELNQLKEGNVLMRTACDIDGKKINGNLVLSPSLANQTLALNGTEVAKDIIVRGGHLALKQAKVNGQITVKAADNTNISGGANLIVAETPVTLTDGTYNEVRGSQVTIGSNAKVVKPIDGKQPAPGRSPFLPQGPGSSSGSGTTQGNKGTLKNPAVLTLDGQKVYFAKLTDDEAANFNNQTMMVNGTEMPILPVTQDNKIVKAKTGTLSDRYGTANLTYAQLYYGELKTSPDNNESPIDTRQTLTPDRNLNKEGLYDSVTSATTISKNGKAGSHNQLYPKILNYNGNVNTSSLKAHLVKGERNPDTGIVEQKGAVQTVPAKMEINGIKGYPVRIPGRLYENLEILKALKLTDNAAVKTYTTISNITASPQMANHHANGILTPADRYKTLLSDGTYSAEAKMTSAAPKKVTGKVSANHFRGVQPDDHTSRYSEYELGITPELEAEDAKNFFDNLYALVLTDPTGKQSGAVYYEDIWIEKGKITFALTSDKHDEYYHTSHANPLLAYQINRFGSLPKGEYTLTLKSLGYEDMTIKAQKKESYGKDIISSLPVIKKQYMKKDGDVTFTVPANLPQGEMTLAVANRGWQDIQDDTLIHFDKDKKNIIAKKAGRYAIKISAPDKVDLYIPFTLAKNAIENPDGFLAQKALWNANGPTLVTLARTDWPDQRNLKEKLQKQAGKDRKGRPIWTDVAPENYSLDKVAKTLTLQPAAGAGQYRLVVTGDVYEDLIIPVDLTTEKKVLPNKGDYTMGATPLNADGPTVVQLPNIEKRTLKKTSLQKDKAAAPLAPENYTLSLTDKTLTIKNLSKADTGHYTLRIESDEYEDLTLTFELTAAAKKANGSYDQIVPVKAVDGGTTTVTLPANIEKRHITNAVLVNKTAPDKVLKQDLDWFLHFDDHTVDIKNAAVGSYELTLVSDEYEDLTLSFEVQPNANYTVKGLAHAKRTRDWKRAESYYVVATVTFNDKHEVVDYDFTPAYAVDGVDPKNEKGNATIDQVRILELDGKTDDGKKIYTAEFSANQVYWDSMYYGDEFGDDPTRTIFSIINGKADKSKATFEGLKTTYKGDSTDAVSGATITCNAAKESILNAFKVFEAQFKK